MISDVITHIPGIPYGPAPRAAAVTAALAWPPGIVVIHDTGNPNSTAAGEASYAATRTDPQQYWTSAHCYVDRTGILGSLTLDKRAWAAYAWANAHGFHVEICLADKNDPTTIMWAAHATMLLCQAAGIPMVRVTPAQIAAGTARGICGHHDITLAHIDQNDHTDPDPFNWDLFMSMVTGGGAGDGDEDSMGASFGPIEILPPGQITSLCIPPVQAGTADKRAAWLDICNATGDTPYRLRAFYSTGSANSWQPLAGDNWTNGERTIAGGERVSVSLPVGCAALDIRRLSAGGAPVYDGQLTVCLERGPVLPQ